jgi:hypothetical protein
MSILVWFLSEVKKKDANGIIDVLQTLDLLLGWDIAPSQIPSIVLSFVLNPSLGVEGIVLRNKKKTCYTDTHCTRPKQTSLEILQIVEIFRNNVSNISVHLNQ